MKCLLKIKSGPISTNSAYYKRNNSFNEKTRAYRANFLHHLQNDYNKNQIAKIKSHFDPSKHCLKVVFTWYQPEDILFTKEGKISLRSMDVDNCLKIPTDLVFDKKYNDKWLSLRKGREQMLYREFPSLSNLDINDKFIISTTSIKALSLDSEFHCTVEVQILPLPKRQG